MFRKTVLLVTSAVLLTAVALPLTIGIGHAQSKCKPVNGHIVSELLTGPECTSPVGLCTSGRFIGGINGDFVFIATRSLSMKQAVGLVRLKLPYGNCPAIIASPGYDAPLSPALGERS